MPRNMMKCDDNGIRATVFEIERFAVNDGPGIRTLVFFKGCPLRCKWCSNPESGQARPQLMYWKTRCLGCGNCVKNCPKGALSFNNGVEVDKEKCVLCGQCTDLCNAGALTLVGRSMSVDDVFNAIERDAAFYESTGGGVTFSGGEPLLHAEFLDVLLTKLKAKGRHVCVETTGQVDYAVIERLMDRIDIFLYDFKCMDSDKHNEYTGRTNELSLNNFIKLVGAGGNAVARVPVIPTFNDSNENFAALRDFLQAHNPGCKVDLLPYHRLGISKYDRLGLPYPAGDIDPPPNTRMQEIKNFFDMAGFQVSIGG